MQTLIRCLFEIMLKQHNAGRWKQDAESSRTKPFVTCLSPGHFSGLATVLP